MYDEKNYNLLEPRVDLSRVPRVVEGIVRSIGNPFLPGGNTHSCLRILQSKFKIASPFTPFYFGFPFHEATSGDT